MKRFVLFCAAAALIAGCGNTPYKRLATAYNSLELTKSLGEEFDKAVKAYLETKRVECKSKHQIKTAEFDACILPAIRLARAWTGERAGKKTGKGALQALQAAQKATKLALDAAYDYIKSHESKCGKKDAPKDCHGDWKALLKPGLCAAWAVVDEGIKLGAYKFTSDSTYKTVSAMIEAFACGK